MESSQQQSVVVIGGGPAGYACAIRAAQRGRDVTIVEQSKLGGTCLNHGCIPSKALISATDLAHRAGDARRMGIEADPTIDHQRMVRWKDGIVRRLTKGVEHLIEKNGITYLAGTGEFLGNESVRIHLEDGETTVREFDRAVIATGSRPIEVPSLPFESPGILDAKAALALEETPESIAIVGAGYIGMELAGVFAKLGTTVTVVELLDDILPQYPNDLTKPIHSRAEQLGIAFHLGTAVEGMEQDGDEIVLQTNGDAIRAECALVAVGREPVTDTINLAAVGLETTDNGAIETDETGRTSTDAIFAVGDVTGDPMLAHAGIAEGIVAAETIADRSASLDVDTVPEVVFTDPELARVGLTKEVAAAEDRAVIVGEFPLRANGRTLTLNRRDGFVRVVADATTEQIIGGSVVGPEASELIGEIGLAITMQATLTELGETIHAHPTLSEAIMEAAEHGRGIAIHRLN